MSDEDDDPTYSPESDAPETEQLSRKKPSKPTITITRGKPTDFFSEVKEQVNAIKKLPIFDLNEFKLYFNFTYPILRNPAFASIIQYDVADLGILNQDFENCASSMIAYYSRGKGRPLLSSSITIDKMKTSIDLLDWVLFVGLDSIRLELILQRSDNFHIIDYRDIEKILNYFENLNEIELQRLKDFRTECRYKLFDGKINHYIYKHVDGNGKIWYVCRDVELPWHIPIYSNYFNSKAVRPEWATTEEMILLGRMFEGNSKVYDKRNNQPTLHQFFEQVGSMAEKLVPRNVAGQFLSYTRLFPYGKYFYYCKSHNDLRILHSNHLGYCLFLFFPKLLIDSHLNKIWIPFGTTVCQFSGEVRSLDLSVPSNIEMKYGNVHSNHRTYYVVTNKYDDSTRPGLGDCAFFANSCCRRYEKNVNFQCAESHIWTSKSSVIKDQSFLEKFIALNACKNITGQQIKEWNEQNRPYFLSWFNANCILDSEYIFPVEFCYQKKEHRVAKIEQSVGNTMCQCMTSCSGKIPELRGRLDLFDDVLVPREYCSSPEITEKIKTHKDQYRHSRSVMKFKNQVNDYFQLYLNQFSV